MFATNMTYYFSLVRQILSIGLIDKFNQLGKVTKAFTNDAFSAEGNADKGATITLTPARVEAELEFRAHELFNKMKGQLMRDGHDFDNIDGSVKKKVSYRNEFCLVEVGFLTTNMNIC